MKLWPKASQMDIICLNIFESIKIFMRKGDFATGFGNHILGYKDLLNQIK